MANKITKERTLIEVPCEVFNSSEKQRDMLITGTSFDDVFLQIGKISNSWSFTSTDLKIVDRVIARKFSEWLHPSGKNDPTNYIRCGGSMY